MTDPVTLEGALRPVGEFDEKRAENAVRELLIAVGEDPTARVFGRPPRGWPGRTGRSSPGSTRSPRTS